MFRLREQIGGDENRVAGRVGDHEDLGGSGDHIDRDHAENLLFGFCDEGVAGADDLVDLRDALGAVGERGDRLRASDLENAVDARDVGGGEDRGIDLSVLAGRRHHHDGFAAGDLGGDRVHQNG